MSVAWKLMKKGENGVFEAATVKPGVVIPPTHVIGAVIDTGSPETMSIMMQLGEIADIYWISRTATVAAVVFPSGMSWAQAQALLKRAADLREAQILRYVKEGPGMAKVRSGLRRMRSKYGF